MGVLGWLGDVCESLCRLYYVLFIRRVLFFSLAAPYKCLFPCLILVVHESINNLQFSAKVSLNFKELFECQVSNLSLYNNNLKLFRKKSYAPFWGDS